MTSKGMREKRRAKFGVGFGTDGEKRGRNKIVGGRKELDLNLVRVCE